MEEPAEEKGKLPPGGRYRSTLFGGVKARTALSIPHKNRDEESRLEEQLSWKDFDGRGKPKEEEERSKIQAGKPCGTSELDYRRTPGRLISRDTPTEKTKRGDV